MTDQKHDGFIDKVDLGTLAPAYAKVGGSFEELGKTPYFADSTKYAAYDDDYSNLGPFQTNSKPNSPKVIVNLKFRQIFCDSDVT